MNKQFVIVNMRVHNLFLPRNQKTRDAFLYFFQRSGFLEGGLSHD